MRIFVLRARSAPTDSRRFLTSVGGEAHVEILAQTLTNTLLLSKDHYRDVVVYLVLEATADYARTIRFDSNRLQDLGGFHEGAMLATIADALALSGELGKEEEIDAAAGISVRTISFEHLLKQLAEQYPLYVLHRKGADIRRVQFSENPCFVLTDHIPMPKKTFHTLKRLGAENISVGPRMLFASQCVVLIHNELDRRMA
ncbi:MAG: tRNA (pseudouridine(54)-N(1))-methyltransferase TrmY [Pseudomonadales bacterium]|jgi:tRNA (pseudouridine54-N1)-methyltransferase|nr:tRNA (pseudouridine(54)-N(1))-methyltransferase TrmY [Pseudomonadales bacterium]MDP7594657.1 tRNA (pseudouridine(54)-N(1))-methyltransferase TrmY [Pseudomonadales bacterium]HJN49739.1 tRNA (pseudouridine(54)-N(1))-methyltransferase TrmY [Pseudomonadales bacterium]|tara:strand:- start:179 stop:778 length:600 start_codon:yes stop_codon:yes gene_type:complete